MARRWGQTHAWSLRPKQVADDEIVAKGKRAIVIELHYSNRDDRYGFKIRVMRGRFPFLKTNGRNNRVYHRQITWTTGE